jgi:hypothetical protein
MGKLFLTKGRNKRIKARELSNALAPLANMKTLSIPDFTETAVLPNGWLEKEIAPLIIKADESTLYEYEDQLKAIADLLERKNPIARVEIEKALRIVDCRKGELFGEAKLGRPKDGNVSSMKLNSNKVEVSRCRKIASHWKELWPRIREASDESAVTRAAVLRMINNTREQTKSKAAPKPHPQEEEIAILHDRGLTNPEIAAGVGLSKFTIQEIVRDIKIKRNVEPTITPDMLSMTARQKLELAIKQHKEKLSAQWQVALSAKVDQLLLNSIGPRLRKEQEEARRVMKSRKGIMDRPGYKKILACLHPDRINQFIIDPKLRQDYNEAWHLFRAVEKLLLDEKNSPTEFIGIPKTAAEWDALKRQTSEARKTARRAGLAKR